MSLYKSYDKLFSNVLENKVIDPASYFEFYIYKLLNENALVATNGKIINNFKIKNDLPISHAPPGPDIEVFLNNIAFICECSLKTGAKQFDDEHESVSRHLEEFNDKYKNKYKIILCFFIAPEIGSEIQDWYYSLSKEINIIPIRLQDFTNLMCKLSNIEIKRYEEIITAMLGIVTRIKNGTEWIKTIAEYITEL